MTRSLVTGGHGFIGSHLARALLARGDHVTVIDRADPAPGHSGLELQGIAGQVELIECDIADRDRLASAMKEIGEQGIDSVFHLAAQTLVGPAMQDPVATFEANVAGTCHLLEACRQMGEPPRIIVASSDKAYGRSDDLPYREEQALRPGSPYEASKAATEMVAAAYRRSYGLTLAVTRFANVYGGGDLNASRLVPELMAAAVSGRGPKIRSDGSPERDYLYIDDAVEAYLAIDSYLRDQTEAATSTDGTGSTFNAGSGRSWSVLQLIEMLEGITGRPLGAEFLGAGVPAGEIDRQCVDSGRLRWQTGWQPQVELAEGLARSYAWYVENVYLLEAGASRRFVPPSISLDGPRSG